MSIEEHLETLSGNAPGCSLAAYGDISARLILRSRAEAPCRREVLDRLCAEAADVFQRNDRVVLPETPGTEETGLCILSFDASEMRVFARERRGSEEVVCAVFKGPHTTEQDLAAVKNCARQIAEAST